MANSTDYARQWRENKIAQQLCPRCGRKNTSAAKTCAKCRKTMLANKKKNAQRGLCLDCTRPAMSERTRCSVCVENKGNRTRELRKEVLLAYGGRCMCPGGCTETNLGFLTFDHVNNDGAAHRREVSATMLPSWLKKNGFPKTVRVLCYNCNCARRLGSCPHEQEKTNGS